MNNRDVFPENPAVPLSSNDMGGELAQIHDLQFSALELQLYLDTHPHDLGALALYNQYHRDLMRCLREYESRHGPLLGNGFSASPRNSWGWLDGPWPWEVNYG
ncbi:MAG: spore coat protein CotJB [Gracilibacteraceae bacterium]|jgi:spore coat protein JB|nr:spore coat protein CotJB [Gracilibacteraceae bacterium]